MEPIVLNITDAILDERPDIPGLHQMGFEPGHVPDVVGKVRNIIFDWVSLLKSLRPQPPERRAYYHTREANGQSTAKLKLKIVSSSQETGS